MLGRTMTWAAIAAALYFGLQMYGSSKHAAGYQEAQLEYALKAAKAEQAERAKEQKLQSGVEIVRTENQALRDSAVVAANSSAAAVSSLRDSLAAANSRAERETARAGRALDESARIAAELRNVVGACAAEYRDLAEVADGYRGDLIGLQGYVRVVVDGKRVKQTAPLSTQRVGGVTLDIY